MIDNSPVCGDCYKVVLVLYYNTTYVNPQSILDRKHLLWYLQLGCGRRVPCVGWKKLPLWLHEGKLKGSKAWPKTHFKIICFQCSECDVTLKGRYYTVNGKFICEEDYKVKLSQQHRALGPSHDLLSDTEEWEELQWLWRGYWRTILHSGQWESHLWKGL